MSCGFNRLDESANAIYLLQLFRIVEGKVIEILSEETHCPAEYLEIIKDESILISLYLQLKQFIGLCCKKLF